MTQLERIQNATSDDFLFPADLHIRPNSTTSEVDDGVSAFLEVRRNLFGIAYHMLKSAAEAEDIVQDAWLRWQNTDRSLVLNPPAFLMTITTRMCINVCRSARSRRETYVGSWLSEPVATDADPGRGVERKEALKVAVVILLEKLRPAERAAYILREAFDYSSRQIADILQLNETNVRQLLTRARRHIAEERRARASSTDQRRLLATLIDAAENGNLAGLEVFLASDVDIHSDEARDGAMNHGCPDPSRSPRPEKTLTWCHKTIGYSVLTSTTGSCDVSTSLETPSRR